MSAHAGIRVDIPEMPPSEPSAEMPPSRPSPESRSFTEPSLPAGQPRPLYIPGALGSTFAIFHPPAHEAGTTGVLLCPPFGNDELCCHRPRRAWAMQLSELGHPTLRIDLPGSGESDGGPRDPERLRAWTEGAAAAARWLRANTACERIAAIGIGLGGMLAYRAAAQGAPIDDLILWAVPARGRTLVRELRALARLEASASEQESTEPDALLPEGFLVSAGFVMSAETVESLQELDLTTLALPEPHRRRALLLERDGLPPDSRLRDALQDAGVDVGVKPGPGYGAMVAVPQYSEAPTEVLATVAAWLAQDTEPSATSLGDIPDPRIDHPSSTPSPGVRESPLYFEESFGDLLGVLAEPSESPSEPPALCAVLLNSGAQRRIGPNRMWVEIARRWAQRGIPTLRVDLAGIGDSDSDGTVWGNDEGFYVPQFIDQVRRVLDVLQDRGLPPRFVLFGLCSGAYWSMHTALADERVAGAFMVNSRALFWHDRLEGIRAARNLRKASKPITWLRLVRGEITRQRVTTIARGAWMSLLALPERLRTRLRSRTRGEDELDAALRRLGEQDQRLLVAFTPEETLLEELEADGGLTRLHAHPNVHVELVGGALASHTLEPLPLQRAVHDLLDRALDRELERAPR